MEQNGNGTNETVSWLGTTAHLQYQFTKLYAAALRGEYLRDVDGAVMSTTAAVPRNLFSGTWTNRFMLTDSLESRFEFRFDYAANPVFSKNNGSLGNYQTTLLLAAIYTWGQGF